MISLLSRSKCERGADPSFEVQRSRRLVDGCLDFPALVADFCIGRACDLSADAVSVRNQDDAEFAAFGYSWNGWFARLAQAKEQTPSGRAFVPQRQQFLTG
jgi:hypothetical protein